MVAAFELCFSIKKEFLKKKVSGEIAFELISLFHVDIQEFVWLNVAPVASPQLEI